MTIVVPTPTGVSAIKGDNVLKVDGDGSLDYVVGDGIFVTDGSRVQRNIVAGVSEGGRGLTVENPWQFAANGASVFRLVREDEINRLTQRQFTAAMAAVKSRLPNETDRKV